MADSRDPENRRALLLISKQHVKACEKRHLPGQEQVSNTRTGKVESARRPHTLDNVLIYLIEKTTNEFLFGSRDVTPQGVERLDYLEPFQASFLWLRGKTMIEEFFDGCSFRVGVSIVRNQTNQSTCGIIVLACPEIRNGCGHDLLRKSPMPVACQYVTLL
jgi:hypothetical protein